MTEHNTTAPEENKMSLDKAYNIIRNFCKQRHGSCSGCLFELDMENAPDSMSTCLFCLGYKPHSWRRLERKLDNPEDVIV